MHVMLSILLYLQLIFSPGEYSQQHIDDTVSANQSDYNAVYYDPVAQNTAVDLYGDQVQYIEIWDRHEDD